VRGLAANKRSMAWSEQQVRGEGRAAEAGWLTRLVYWCVRRKFRTLTGKNRLITPVKVAAHHPRLLKAIGRMEGGRSGRALGARRAEAARHARGGPAHRLPMLT
jgi:hypothetical protein